MPTEREREYYAMGFADGFKQASTSVPMFGSTPVGKEARKRFESKPKRKLSAWNKFVKANSKKKIYRYANGKLKLKKMGIAFRKKKRR